MAIRWSRISLSLLLRSRGNPSGGTRSNFEVRAIFKIPIPWASNFSEASSRSFSNYEEGGVAASSVNYYGVDQVGSVRRVFNTSAAPTYDFDPYGNALQSTAAVTDFGYAGLFYNSDSGLYLTNTRLLVPYRVAFSPAIRWGEVGDPYANSMPMLREILCCLVILRDSFVCRPS